MTRVNVGIPVRSLSNPHLIAEHREIKRIPNKVKKGIYRLDKPIPDKFSLNQGHERFFIYRLGYLKRRYEEIYRECLKRNIDVQYYGAAWEGIPDEHMGEYEPTKRDALILISRINERGGLMKEFNLNTITV